MGAKGYVNGPGGRAPGRRATGYEVESAQDGDSGFERALEGSFDLILLDVALPGRGGFDVLRDLRQKKVETPVLMLTARSQVIDRVLGLKLGADDYLPKPFDMMELLARIEAVLRRRQGAEPGTTGSFTFGDVRVDFRRAQVSRAGKPVDLPSLEFKLLRYFIEHRGTRRRRPRSRRARFPGARRWARGTRRISPRSLRFVRPIDIFRGRVIVMGLWRGELSPSS
jgi:DNA-binding response OmpR family regulator